MHILLPSYPLRLGQEQGWVPIALATESSAPHGRWGAIFTSRFPLPSACVWGCQDSGDCVHSPLNRGVQLEAL